jgi:DNA-binding LacI/PurR family transcriptional regulator
MGTTLMVDAILRRPAAGHRCRHSVADSDSGPDALVAMSDELALGALHSAHDVGIAVPDVMVVTVWDDTDAGPGVPGWHPLGRGCRI